MSYDPNAPRNPDQRPLPPGWITLFDPNYRTWYYVNTQSGNPAYTTWIHPHDPQPNQYPGSPQGQYGGGGGGGYPQQPQMGGYGGSHGPQTVYVQEQHKSSGPGMGTALAVGGAGLVGGVLIADAIGDSQMEAYQEGLEDGAELEDD